MLTGIPWVGASILGASALSNRASISIVLGLFLALFAGSGPVHARADCPGVVHLTDADAAVNLAQHISMASGPPGALPPVGAETPYCDDYIRLSQADEITRIRFQLQNDTGAANDWVVTIGGVFFEQAALIDPSLPLGSAVISRFPPSPEAGLYATKPAMEVRLASGERRELILEIHNSILPNAIASVTSRANFDRLELSTLLQLSIPTGFLTCMIILTMFVGLSVRRYATLFYCGYLASFMASILIYNGVPLKFGLTGLYGETANSIYSTLELSANVCMAFLLSKMLDYRTNLPRFQKMPWLLAIASVLILLLQDWVPESVDNRVKSLTLIAGSIIALAAIIKLSLRGYTPARLLAASAAFMFAGLVVGATIYQNPQFIFENFEEPVRIYETAGIWLFPTAIMIEVAFISMAFSIHTREWRQKLEWELAQTKKQNVDYQADIKFVKAQAEISKPLTAEGPLEADVFLTKVTNSIRNNIRNEDFGVAALAADMAMSERSLRRKIKAACNLSLTEFIQRERLAFADSLIRQRAYATASEVAYAVGYSSPSYFAKLYKQAFSISPAEALKRAA